LQQYVNCKILKAGWKLTRDKSCASHKTSTNNTHTLCPGGWEEKSKFVCRSIVPAKKREKHKRDEEKPSLSPWSFPDLLHRPSGGGSPLSAEIEGNLLEQLINIWSVCMKLFRVKLIFTGFPV